MFVLLGRKIDWPKKHIEKADEGQTLKYQLNGVCTSYVTTNSIEKCRIGKCIFDETVFAEVFKELNRYLDQSAESKWFSFFGRNSSWHEYLKYDGNFFVLHTAHTDLVVYIFRKK